METTAAILESLVAIALMGLMFGMPPAAFIFAALAYSNTRKILSKLDGMTMHT